MTLKDDILKNICSIQEAQKEIDMSRNLVAKFDEVRSKTIDAEKKGVNKVEIVCSIGPSKITFIIDDQDLLKDYKNDLNNKDLMMDMLNDYLDKMKDQGKMRIVSAKKL
jgi:hypothetical protein